MPGSTASSVRQTASQLRMTTPVTIQQLAERYETLLFDSYGVLVDESAGLPDARELIAWLESTGKNYMIVTNDASRSIESRAAKFVEQGVPVPAERIVNSGCLIPQFIKQNGFEGAPTAVFGSRDAIGYVRQGDAEILSFDRIAEARLFVLADDAGFDWRPSVNRLISVLNQKRLDSEPFTLLLPNPDLVYPSGVREYSFAAAALAEMIESALTRLFGEAPDHRFIRLGKPYAPIFDEALSRVGSKSRDSVVMIGDQFETDIAGAVSYGISSAIVTTGINRLKTADELSKLPAEHRPDYLLSSLATDDA